MRLTDLNPNWCNAGGPGIYRKNEAGELVEAPEREGIGLMYDCPCGCGDRRYVPFENPLDGGAPVDGDRARWKRTGEDFETLTLSPSIQHVPHESGGCAWHGFIENGGVRTV